jgi:SAM-dependent methyltransferase
VIDRRLLDAVLELAPNQPATALWRAAELGHLLREDPLPREGIGLDLGCGDGRMTLLVAHELGARWQLAGVDPDECELALAAELGLYERLHAAPGDAIPEDDASFDFVFSNSVLEHIPQVENVLDETARLLRPGGVLVATVPTAALHELLRGPGLLGRVATGACDRASYLAALDERVAHVNLWPVQRWRDELGRRGLAVERASEYLPRAEVRRWEAWANATGGVAARLAGRDARPIDVQRSLGLRTSAPPPWLQLAGRALGRSAAIGLDGDDDGGHGACVLLVARRA